MKAISKRIAVLLVSVLLLACMAVGSASPAFAAVKYYNSYSDIAAIKDKSSCPSMQGIAVGSTYIYSVKVNGDTNKSAFISKTNRKTGSTVTLKTSSGATTFNYLGHANDMDVTSINDKSNLFIATMTTGSKSLVRMEVNGSTIAKKGNYTLKYNGENMSISGVAVYKKTDSKITLLVKKGQTYYTGSLKPTATSGTINLTKVFSLDLKNVKINGKKTDVSSFVGQGFGYDKNLIYVPLHSDKNKGQSVVVVYNIKNASGKITSDPNLSFRITSSTYAALFEIESCGISSDGKLYFNTNRRKSNSNTNWDGIHVFKDYKVS